MWTGNLGGAAYGNGVYFSFDKSVAMSSNYMGKGGELITAAISKDAEVADYSNVLEEHFEFRKIFDTSTEINEDVMQVLVDVGQYAAIKGYDAIATNGFNGNNYMVVLNREKLIIME